MTIKDKVSKAIKIAITEVVTKERDSLKEISDDLTEVVMNIIITEIGKIKE